VHHFTAHRLTFIAEARETIELNEHQGSAIRGTLFHALLERFCMNREAPECVACPLVAFLVSILNPESDRDRDVPRPFTVQPLRPRPSPACCATKPGWPITPSACSALTRCSKWPFNSRATRPC